MFNQSLSQLVQSYICMRQIFRTTGRSVYQTPIHTGFPQRCVTTLWKSNRLHPTDDLYKSYHCDICRLSHSRGKPRRLTTRRHQGTLSQISGLFHVLVNCDIAFHCSSFHSLEARDRASKVEPLAGHHPGIEERYEAHLCRVKDVSCKVEEEHRSIQN